MYLCGDGITQVILKLFINAIHDNSQSFREFYQDSMLLSAALERVVIGNGDLHAGGLSCLGTIFAAHYRDFLNVLQYAIEWNRLNGLDISNHFSTARN